VRAAAAIAALCFACHSAKPCTACDCGRAGIFRLDVELPHVDQGNSTDADETWPNATLTYGDDLDGHSTTMIGPTADGGTLTVALNRGLGLAAGLKPTAGTWYNEVDWNFVSSGAALSFEDRGVQLIVHGGAPSSLETMVLAPVTQYAVDEGAGTLSVTMDGQTITAPFHQQVQFTRRGAPWCLAVDEVTQGFATQSHWVVFQLDALEEE